MWSVVSFGKFRGKDLSLPQVLLKDPDWFFWAIDEGAFRGAQATEAAKLARRANAIRIPAGLESTHCVQYWLTPDGKFSGFAVIEKSQPPHVGSSSEIRRPVLDLAAPRSIKGYDKLGCKLMLKTFKYYWFDGKIFRKSAVEAFFNNPTNFLNP